MAKHDWGCRSLGEVAYLEHDPNRVLPLPVTMNNVQFDEVAGVGIKRVPDEIDIVHIIKIPALSNQRVPENVFKGDGVLVEAGRHSFSADELERRFTDNWLVSWNRASSPWRADLSAE